MSLRTYVGGAGAILKNIAGLIVFIFLVYSLYFTGSFELTIFKGILGIVLLLIFCVTSSMIPFGITFAPIIFEWWFHDIPFWEFTTGAWVVTGISMTANILLIAGIFSREEEL
jgi:hypothetical protein